MPTAKELSEKVGYGEIEIPNGSTFVQTCMIEFAKLHVEQALKEASENAKVQNIYPKYVLNEHDEIEHFIADKDSILNSYLLDKIK